MSPLLPFALLFVLFGVLLFLLHRHSRRARHLLAQEIHDRALAMDQRCDALQKQVDQLEMRRRIDQLALLVDHGERSGRLSPEAAEKLRQQTLELRQESAEG